MTKEERIFKKTNGRCHFCGDRLTQDNRGYPAKEEAWNGHWEVDHVVYRKRGGPDSEENCLPACTRCNRLRWQRRGKKLRYLLVLGQVANNQIKDSTTTGHKLTALLEGQSAANLRRRAQA